MNKKSALIVWILSDLSIIACMPHIREWQLKAVLIMGPLFILNLIALFESNNRPPAK